MTQKRPTTRSWNPFVGCNFDCTYCAPSFKKLLAWLGRMHKCVPCQNYAPHEHPERLTRIPSDRAIFACEDGDIAFANPKFMAKVFKAMRNDKRERTWFVQSKNPACLRQYLTQLPESTYLATTFETNRDELCKKISKAPPVSKRYKDFLNLNWSKKIVNVEPIMDFDLSPLSKMILNIKPCAVSSVTTANLKLCHYLNHQKRKLCNWLANWKIKAFKFSEDGKTRTMLISVRA